MYRTLAKLSGCGVLDEERGREIYYSYIPARCDKSFWSQDVPFYFDVSELIFT